MVLRDPGPHLLEREDWDFSNCPEDQLEACFFYEIARECPNIRRARTLQLAKAAPENGHEQRSAITIVDLFKDFPDFPGKPFLSILKSERARRIANLKNTVPPVQADLSALIRQYATNPPGTKTIKYPMGVIAAFFIDWRSSDEKLAQGFRRWLRANRPAQAIPMVRKGKGSSREQLKKDLKALGAFRLLKETKWEDAYVYTLSILRNKRGNPQGLFGSHASEWARARKHAQEIITNVCAFLERLI